MQALEIVTAISFAAKGIANLEHKVVLDEKTMQVSLVYSAPPSCSIRTVTKGVSGFLFGQESPLSNFQSAREALAKDGISVAMEVTQIETLALPK